MPKKKVYAVAVGRNVGIYDRWDECEKQVKGFRNARYKSFSDRSEAEKFIEENKVAEKRAKGEDSSAPNKRRKVDDPLARKIEIHMNFDGGSRGNPGVAGAGAEVIIRFLPFEKKESIIERKKIRIREYLGINSTNNEAEYQGVVSGLIHALNEVRDFVTLHSLTEDTCQVKLVVQGDSDLIIQQLIGSYNCNSPKLQPFHKKAKQIVFDMKKIASVDVTYEHVYRKYNTVADALANEAMDGRRSWVTKDDEDDIERNQARPVSSK